MIQFKYQVRDSGGVFAAGVIAAEGLDDASRLLRREGKTIISLQESTGLDEQAVLAGRPKRIRRDDVIFFANQLAVMVDTGVPISEALDAIGSQTEHSGMKAVLRDLSDRVKGGLEFSSALQEHPKVFNRLFISLMKASEASGTMGQMLIRVAEYMKRERDTRKAIKGAMVYPLCMLGFAVCVVIALLIFVLPRFEKIYAGKSALLPLPTRVLLGMSKGIIAYWPLLLGGLAAVVVGAILYLRTPGGQLMMDRLRVKVPIFGAMFRKSCLARCLRTMSTMVSSGVSMLDGLSITAQVAGNRLYAEVWEKLAQRVEEGSTLADPLFEHRLIPATVAQMVSAGERTGKLGLVLNRVAEFCEDDLKTAVKTVTSMIEPIMIIVMGFIVGGIAMALLLPVFSMAQLVAH